MTANVTVAYANQYDGKKVHIKFQQFDQNEKVWKDVEHDSNEAIIGLNECRPSLMIHNTRRMIIEEIE